MKPPRPKPFSTSITQLKLSNRAGDPQPALIDLVLQFRKADGRLAPKVFKWTETAVAPGAALTLEKRLPLRAVTTRRHYAGAQAAEVQVNGQVLAGAEFTLQIDDQE